MSEDEQAKELLRIRREIQEGTRVFACLQSRKRRYIEHLTMMLHALEDTMPDEVMAFEDAYPSFDAYPSKEELQRLFDEYFTTREKLRSAKQLNERF